MRVKVKFTVKFPACSKPETHTYGEFDCDLTLTLKSGVAVTRSKNGKETDGDPENVAWSKTTLEGQSQFMVKKPSARSHR